MWRWRYSVSVNDNNKINYFFNVFGIVVLMKEIMKKWVNIVNRIKIC